MTKKQKRLVLISAVFAVAAGAAALTLFALRGSITYFYTPGDIAALEAPPTSPIRLGGLVAAGSLRQAGYGQSKTAIVSFDVTDGEGIINVSYAGILPDLFREGQGVIVQGRLDPGGVTMTADNVLAKHDENYMPKEVADALKEKGQWRADEAGS